ncbi:hypothetical protein J8L86_07615 [Shewanella sp. MMG014]|uniref:hypothetical protein n=1 Tax=Shewanella sp. MMG014 TaxID=2822691 RepID=UPI001B3850A9|nr:hypothetical protein [Shewanella sp. MMG014]MBQ4889710.1 hypothetical protein [Shewanella sp. MMG014]
MLTSKVWSVVGTKPLVSLSYFSNSYCLKLCDLNGFYIVYNGDGKLPVENVVRTIFIFKQKPQEIERLTFECEGECNLILCCSKNIKDELYTMVPMFNGSPLHCNFVGISENITKDNVAIIEGRCKKQLPPNVSVKSFFCDEYEMSQKEVKSQYVVISSFTRLILWGLCVGGGVLGSVLYVVQIYFGGFE